MHVKACPRCHAEHRLPASFCSWCGMPLARIAPQDVGRVQHSEPMPAPLGFSPCAAHPHLAYRWVSGGGEPLLCTEGGVMEVFNGGYDLTDVQMRVVGRREDGGVVFELPVTVAELPRGATRSADVASYEIPAPIERVELVFVSAELAETELG